MNINPRPTQPQNERTTDTVSTSRPSAYQVLVVLLLAGGMLAVADLLVVVVGVLLLAFAGALLGIFISGLGRTCSRWTGLAYPWCYAAVVAILVGAIAGGFYYLGSQVAAQASVLWSELRSASGDFVEQLRQYSWAEGYLPSGAELQSALTNGEVAQQLFAGAQMVSWFATSCIFIFFVGVYTAFDPGLYRRGIVKLVPLAHRHRAEVVLDKLYNALWQWIIARLISMTIIGVCTAIGLWLLGVDMPVTLGVFAGLITFIPHIGPILAAIPQALLALKIGPEVALYVILFNMGLQAFESYLITPTLQRYQVTLPPALLISVQLLMGVCVGLAGILMAAPLTASAMLLVQMLYIGDELGDPNPGRLANDQ